MTPVLDERSELILKCIVDFYLENGSPVSSRAISKKIDLSPATIRNVMADLEDMGLLYSVHTSSGRAPTTDGINMFLSVITTGEELELENIINDIESVHKRVNTLLGTLEETTETISHATNAIGIVAFPKSDSIVECVEIKKISLDRCLLLIILNDGNVESCVFRPSLIPKDNIIEKATDLLNKAISGKYIYEVMDIIKNGIMISPSEFDHEVVSLIKDAIKSETIENPDSYFIVKGHINLFNQIENMDQLNIVKNVINTLESDKLLLKLIKEMNYCDKDSIFIGEDMFNLGFSLIISPCVSNEGKSMGAVAVASPSKRNYKNIIPIIGFAARMISRLQ